jgi:DNA-directed RNA polymerase subunit RPC12/RpoP
MDKKPSTTKKSVSKRLIAEEESRQTELEIMPPECNNKAFFKQRKTPAKEVQPEPTNDEPDEPMEESKEDDEKFLEQLEREERKQSREEGSNFEPEDEDMEKEPSDDDQAEEQEELPKPKRKPNKVSPSAPPPKMAHDDVEMADSEL